MFINKNLEVARCFVNVSVIKEGITQGKYGTTTDSTLSDLSSLQDFLYPNFSRNASPTLDYTHIRPGSNHQPDSTLQRKPTSLRTITKIQLTTSSSDLSSAPVANIFFYETAKAPSKYLAPLAENQHTIKNTLDFAEKLKDRTINQDEIVVSCDVTTTTTTTTTTLLPHNYLSVYQNTSRRKYKPHLRPNIQTTQTAPDFSPLLERITKGTVFSFDGKLYNPVDGCSMGSPLSLALAKIFMCKLEQGVVTMATQFDILRPVRG